MYSDKEIHMFDRVIQVIIAIFLIVLVIVMAQLFVMPAISNWWGAS